MTAFLKAMGSHVGSTICELQVGRPGGEGEGETPMEMEDGCIFQRVFFRVSIWSDLGQTVGCPGNKNLNVSEIAHEMRDASEIFISKRFQTTSGFFITEEFG